MDLCNRKYIKMEEQACWLMSITLVLGRQRDKDYCKFKARLELHSKILSQKTKKGGKQKITWTIISNISILAN